MPKTDNSKLSEEKRNVELTNVFTYLVDGGIETDTVNEIIEIIKYAPGAISEDSGIAYPGGLISHILLSTMLAERISKMISGTFSVDRSSIIKACVLMHISKAEMFVENESDWEVRNRGLLYRFKDSDNRLKSGLKSVVMAMNLGIHLTENEVEAMTCFDKEPEQKFTTRFDNILTTIVRQANELAYAIEVERKKKEQK